MLIQRGTKIILLVAGAVVFTFVGWLLAQILLVLDFAAPNHPWWSSIILLIVMIAIPLALSLTLLLNAIDAAAHRKVGRSFTFLICATLAPVAGIALGTGLRFLRWLP